ncbi:type III secretion HpaP family protein [Bordetella sp. N]|uniref:type III secretion HpaP family protein n=1 Tax=Bordetella sp. N TaxID=1746199 RepID=UPI00070C724F|nr:type III secretion HpaP family protein [Bordetella sp. N]ALM86428.1 hypothetical protein ASB57_28955 [Bordetella sp. N]
MTTTRTSNPPGPQSAVQAVQAMQTPQALARTTDGSRDQGSAARASDKAGAERKETRGAEKSGHARRGGDPAMSEVLVKADQRAGARDDLEYAAGVFAAHYVDRDKNGDLDDAGLSGKSDGKDRGTAPAAQPDMRADAQGALVARPHAPLAATLTTRLVSMLSLIDKDGRRAVRMDLRLARLPKTSVTLENLPERLQVTFESSVAAALDLLGKETPRLADDLALRRKRDCSVLVNTAPPLSETRYRADAQAPGGPDPAALPGSA